MNAMDRETLSKIWVEVSGVGVAVGSGVGVAMAVAVGVWVSVGEDVAVDVATGVGVLAGCVVAVGTGSSSHAARRPAIATHIRTMHTTRRQASGSLNSKKRRVTVIPYPLPSCAQWYCLPALVRRPAGRVEPLGARLALVSLIAAITARLDYLVRIAGCTGYRDCLGRRLLSH